MQTTVERAFQLARSGECSTLNDIRNKLRLERRDQIEQHLAGRLIRQQLRDALAANLTP